MKKIIFLLASLVAIFTAIANNYMHVYLNNGSILDFDTDSILQVDVLKDSVTNSNYLLVVKNDSSTLRIEKSDIQKITYDDTTFKVEPVTEHEYVDLGLPSGTLWATYNVGATKPTEYGDYFAWGETEPKEDYNFSTYLWCENKKFDEDGSMPQDFTKYNVDSSYGTVDNKTVLEAEDDAATANWGEDWRMPTLDELQELRAGCRWKWVKNFDGSGVNGRLGTSKVNGSTIFLPAAGYCSGTLQHVGESGNYWSSTLTKYSPAGAFQLSFYKDYDYGCGYEYRFIGISVRPVRSEKAERPKFTVSFFTSDSTLIESQEVQLGYSATKVEVPEIDGFKFIGWSDSSFTNVMKDLDIYAQYKAITKDTLPVSGQIAGHDYVDLGLPSGTLWATYNVGATKPTEYGDYFAWGETNIKKVPSFWKDYKFCDDDLNITKYSMAEDGDSLVTLLPEDDAATANWGNSWRMPTWYEFQELIDGCSWTYKTNVNGISVKGYLGVSKTNNSAIFIPEAGCDYNAAQFEEALYWTSSLIGEGPFLLNSLIPKYAVFADFYYRQNVGCDVNLYDWDVYRNFGLSVRAVANK